MKPSLHFLVLLLCWGLPGFSAPAQTKKVAPFISTADPLVVASQLAQELEGKAGPGDKPIRLEECLAQVFLKNPEIAQQKILIEQALGQKLVFRSRAFPVINTGLLAGQQGERNTTPTTEAQIFALVNGSFRQPLFEASIPASFRRADIGVIVAQQNFQAQAVRILHRARVAYYSALLARSSVQIFLELQAPLDTNIRLEKDRVATGLSARSEVITAEIRKLQLIPGREEARKTYQENLLLMAQLMGSDLKSPSSLQIYPQGPLHYLPVSFSLQAATEEAMKNRPDLQLARSLITQTEDENRITRGGYYPRIELRADAQYLPQTILENSNDVVSSQNERTSEAFMGVGYSWAIIDTGTVTGTSLQHEKAKEIYEINLFALEQEDRKSVV